MKYYIIKQGKELKIMKVKPEDEDSFIEKYLKDILLSADSLQEVLIKFDELLKGG